jgi:multiple sugar transport system substrate-binding protein
LPCRREAIDAALDALVQAGCGCGGTKLLFRSYLDGLQPLLGAFEKAQRRGRTKVEYRKISPPDQYEEILSTALREGRGPDVFLIHASWVPRWAGALLPAPSDLVPLNAVREEFVETVENDLVINGRVVALPLFVDSLALYYNRDIFNASGIARPPRTWNEVHDVVRRTVRFNSTEPGQIDQHGIAAGAGRNVNRAPDILSALLLQKGETFYDSEGTVAFGAEERAQQALRFLTDFANPAKDVYTWQLTSDYSIDAFAEGEAAMMLNYSYHRPTVRAKNPRLNFAVAPFPQVGETDSKDRRTYASYWAFAVSRASPNSQAAWELVRFLASEAPARDYLKRSGYPPARRDLVAELQNDPVIGVFAEQALSARTWRQPDNRVVDRVFTEALDDVVSGRDTVEGALRRAAEQIQAAATALGPRSP